MQFRLKQKLFWSIVEGGMKEDIFKHSIELKQQIEQTKQACYILGKLE